MTGTILDLISPNADRKNLQWAFEIRQLAPFFEFLSTLDESNVLDEDEVDAYEWLCEKPGLMDKIDKISGTTEVSHGIKMLNDEELDERMEELQQQLQLLDTQIMGFSNGNQALEHTVRELEQNIQKSEAKGSRSLENKFRALQQDEVTLGAEYATAINDLKETLQALNIDFSNEGLVSEEESMDGQFLKFLFQMPGKKESLTTANAQFMMAMEKYFQKQFSREFILFADEDTSTSPDVLESDQKEANYRELERLENALGLSHYQESIAQMRVKAVALARNYSANKENIDFIKKELQQKQDDLRVIIQENVHLELFVLLNGEYETKLAKQNYILSHLEECINWLLKQQSWHLFLLSWHGNQISQLEMFCKYLQALEVFSRNEILGSDSRISELRESLKIKEDRQSVDERDSFTRAMYEMIKSHSNDNEKVLLTWEKVEYEIGGFKKEEEESKSLAFKSKLAALVDSFQGTFESLYQELVKKHCKTPGQVLLYPEELFDTQGELLERIESMQPLLQESSQKVRIPTLLSQQKEVFLEFYDRFFNK